MAIERVSETVAVAPRPSFIKTSVYSQVQYEGFRRHKEEVTFRPLLSPVKYADTHYVYINSTRRRYLSRTFYEPRVKPTTYAETTYTCPKTSQEVFVTYLDQTADEKRKWFKTSVEIKARRFRSAQIIPSPTDINSNSLSAVDQTLVEQRLRNNSDNNNNNNSRTGFQNSSDFQGREVFPGISNGSGERFQEVYDPGASQVFIPKKRDSSVQNDQQDLLNGQLILDFPNSKVDLLTNGIHEDDYTDV